MASPVVACIQLDSKHADVAANIERVKQLLAQSQLLQPQDDGPPKHIDLLVLPELALTGYVFDSHEEIEPLLETVNDDASSTSSSSASPTLQLVSALAKQLQCYVLAGFPERGQQGAAPASPPETTAVPDASPAFDGRPVGSRPYAPPNGTGHAFNSALLVGRDGRPLHNFRKHFLYDDDKRWATEGPGFQAVDLPGIGKLCVAICMDLNPYNFEAPFEAYELASFCRREQVKLLVVPMAWLLPQTEATLFDNKRRGPSIQSINYWALRCAPLFEPPISESASTTSAIDAPVREAEESDRRQTTFLVAANRTGTEGTSTFAGSSCVLQINYGENPELLAALGVHEEGVLRAQLDVT